MSSARSALAQLREQIARIEGAGGRTSGALAFGRPELIDVCRVAVNVFSAGSAGCGTRRTIAFLTRDTD